MKLAAMKTRNNLTRIHQTKNMVLTSVPIPVVVEAAFGIVVFRAEAEGEDVGHGAGGGQRPAEGVVGVGGDDLARIGDIVRDVAVVVVEREVPRSADLGGEEAADAARAVERPGEGQHHFWPATHARK